MTSGEARAALLERATTATDILIRLGKMQGQGVTSPRVTTDWLLARMRSDLAALAIRLEGGEGADGFTVSVVREQPGAAAYAIPAKNEVR